MSKQDKDKPSFDPAPKEEWTLISQGAEARVWKIPASGNSNSNSNNDSNSNSQQSFAICKERFSKAYRHPDLDVRLTKSRCRSEAKLLGKCALKSGLRVPKVLRVSPPSLYLEYLDGPTVKSYLQQRQHQKQRQHQQQENDNDNTEKENSSNTNDDAGSATIPETVLARQMGRLVGKLHNIGIVHGDLTTSNMIVLRASKGDYDETEPELELELELALIDLGLSKSTASVEEQAVDLYVLERALLSTHPDLSDAFFDQVLEEYRINTELYQVEMDDDDGNGNGNGNGKNGNGKKRKFHNHTTLQRLEQVRMRGRKRECFG